MTGTTGDITLAAAELEHDSGYGDRCDSYNDGYVHGYDEDGGDGDEGELGDTGEHDGHPDGHSKAPSSWADIVNADELNANYHDLSVWDDINGGDGGCGDGGYDDGDCDDGSYGTTYSGCE